MAPRTPSVKINVQGARGESQADILRRTGQYGVKPTDTDAQAMAKLNAVAIQAANDAQAAKDGAVAAVNYRPTIAEAVADFAVGDFFTSDDQDGITSHAGELRTYKRIAGSPFYEDMGDSAAPNSVADLKNDDGASLIGVYNGKTVEKNISILNDFSLSSVETELNPSDRVNDGRFDWKVAPSSVTDQSVTTAGGKKLYATPIDSGGVNARQFGAKADSGTDDSAAIQKALDTGRDVILDMDTFVAGGLVTKREGQRIILSDRATLKGVTGKSAPIVDLATGYSRIEGGSISAVDATQNAITASGFQTYIDNVNISGTSLNAIELTGLEGRIIFGKQRGGVKNGILVSNADAFLMGPYTEQNGEHGVSSATGSINAYHVHSFNNGLDGFRLSGSSFSVLMSCYADTNGRHGFYISDSAAGLDMTNCWGYKSGNMNPTTPGDYYDFRFSNVRNSNFIGLRSSGEDQNKRASFLFSSNMHGTSVTGAYAGLDARLVYTGHLSFQGGKGRLSRLDMNNNQNKPINATIIASGSTAEFALCLPASIDGANLTVVAIEIEGVFRFSTGTDLPNFEKDVGAIGIGIGGTRAFQKVFKTDSTAYTEVSGISFSIDSLGRPQVTFTVKNLDSSRNIQYAPTVNLISTSRGISPSAP